MRLKPSHRRGSPFGPRRFRPALALRRRPRLWWALTLALAVGVGAAITSVLAAAEATQRSWGETATVLVVDRDVAPGEAIETGDVRAVERPRGAVPPGALDVLPPDAVARTDLLAGEVLLEQRLAPAGLQGVAAAIPRDHRAVAIPVEPGLVPPLVAGDRVDVLVAVAPEAAGSGAPGFAIASEALVLAADELAVTIAVTRDTAPRIAVALGQAAVTLALVGA